MYLIRKYKIHINRFFGADTTRSIVSAGLIAIVVLFLIGYCLASIGAPPMNGRPRDVPCSLDAAWRIANGQVPHKDFYSHLGALPYYVTLLGMKFSPPCVSAVTYGSVCMMAGVACISLLVLSRRTCALYVFIFSVFLGLLVVAPRPLGDPFDYNDYAMLYNRFGEAFLALFSILVFISPRSNAKRPLIDGMEAGIMGLLLACLWFIKLNYFVIGVSLLTLGGALRFISFSRVLISVLSAAFFAAVFLALTHIPLSAMLADFRLMAGAQSSDSKIRTLLIHAIKHIYFSPILLLLAWESCSIKIDTGKLSMLQQWVVPVAILGASLLLIASNSQDDEMPLLAVAAFYGAECIRRQSVALQDEPSLRAGRNVGALCLVLFFTVPIALVDFKAVQHVVVATKKRQIFESAILSSTNLKDFHFNNESTRTTYTKIYLEELEGGILLLQRHQEPGMRLATLIFSNPYHLALGIPPAKGGAICWADNTMNRRSHPSLQRLIGNATHLLVSSSDPGIQGIRDTYGTEWDGLGMEIVESTKKFTLFRLKTPAPDMPQSSMQQ